MELAANCYTHKNSGYKMISEEDGFINDLGLDEWEYTAFLTTVEMQLGINITDEEEYSLYSGKLSGLIDLLTAKADKFA